jgi:hypothetical protein
VLLKQNSPANLVLFWIVGTTTALQVLFELAADGLGNPFASQMKLSGHLSTKWLLEVSGSAWKQVVFVSVWFVWSKLPHLKVLQAFSHETANNDAKNAVMTIKYFIYIK